MVVQIVQISMRHVLFHNLTMLLPQLTIFDMYTLLWFFTCIFIFMTTNSMQNNYNTSRNSLMHPLSIQTPLIPGNHWYILDIYIFTFSIMYKWNHKVCNFLRLVSSLMLHVSVDHFLLLLLLLSNFEWIYHGVSIYPLKNIWVVPVFSDYKYYRHSWIGFCVNMCFYFVYTKYKWDCWVTWEVCLTF